MVARSMAEEDPMAATQPRTSLRAASAVFQPGVEFIAGRTLKPANFQKKITEQRRLSRLGNGGLKWRLVPGSLESDPPEHRGRHVARLSKIQAVVALMHRPRLPTSRPRGSGSSSRFSTIGKEMLRALARPEQQEFLSTTHPRPSDSPS
ncbi:hypothetical protein L1887_47086 [Cichorium endivia]|nr:hypothetical protein L1887_47086 [Cichorium endivia]